MSVNGIESIGGFTPLVAPQVSSTDPATQVTGTGSTGDSFGSMVANGIDNLQQVQNKSDSLAVQAATGDLNAIHQYTIAATEASVTTQLTVAVRNKAVDAFNEIMRMQV
jgi:flagellar hook-basal body complex protein FliE